jgi:hypothetical protein
MDTSPEYKHVFQCTTETLRTQYLSERKYPNKTVEKDKTHVYVQLLCRCVKSKGVCSGAVGVIGIFIDIILPAALMNRVPGGTWKCVRMCRFSLNLGASTF